MRIGGLRWNDRNEEHIARHSVEPHEVEEIVAGGRYDVARIRRQRYVLIGQTDAGRYPSAVVEREPDGVFFVVTARDADRDERRLVVRRRGHR